MPPSTTIERMIADSMKGKLSGLTNPWRVAKNDPAKPANIAPMAKAVSFVFVGLIPRARQAISSSRSASHARPTGSRRTRSVKKLVIRRSEERRVGQEWVVRVDLGCRRVLKKTKKKEK